MGDKTGFLDIGRRDPGKRDVDERLRNYQEIYQSLSEEALREQAARCMDCGVPFCHGVGCPLGNLIPEWNELVHRGRWREASERLHQTNNFPEVTGRVCPALCEAACTVSKDDTSAAVSIRQLELAIVEKAFKEGWVRPQPPARDTRKMVAIIGSGPAGLAAAQQLRRAGHTVYLYEKDSRLGGLLRYGIPNFKLDKEVLDRRITQLKAEGIMIREEVEAGTDLSPAYLRKQFDAIGICIGAGKPRDLDIPGREARGIHFAMDYLSQQIRRSEGLLIPEEESLLATGKQVVIIGGGDTSNDCLGTALRQGAARVTQLEILPKPGESREPGTQPWPMWPNILRPGTAYEEGGARRWSVSTTAFLHREGRLTGLEGVEVAWRKQPGVGMRWEALPGTEFTMKADLVLLAMGFVRPLHQGLLDGLGVEYDQRGNVRTAPETQMSSIEGVFASGDANTGAWLVVGAIAAGRRMAHFIDRYLMGHSSLPYTDPPPKLFAEK